MIIKTVDSDSGHWYAADGSPAYRIIGKNGKERNTTVKDARELKLVPSVTTILNVVAKPGLNTWLQTQVLLAALTLPRRENESEESWLERVMTDSKSTGRDAMDRGTMMHGVLEQFYSGQDSEYPVYVDQVDKAITKHFGVQQWDAEAAQGGVHDYRRAQRPCRGERAAGRGWIGDQGRLSSTGALERRWP